MTEFRTIEGVSMFEKILGWLLDAIRLIIDFVIEILSSKLCSLFSQISERDSAVFKMTSFTEDQLSFYNWSWNIDDDWVQVAT